MHFASIGMILPTAASGHEYLKPAPGSTTIKPNENACWQGTTKARIRFVRTIPISLEMIEKTKMLILTNYKGGFVYERALGSSMSALWESRGQPNPI